MSTEELGHVPVPAHSTTGVMKAEWSEDHIPTQLKIVR
jgi:hypothetical protein